MPEKVKLKNGKGEFVYPVIDPDDVGGGSGGRALGLDVEDNGDGQQSIQCFDLLNVTESHGEQIPTEITAEEFCQAFTLGGSINLFINIIHDSETNYQSGIAFASKWSAGDEKTSMPFITAIMDQDVQTIVVGINNIEWHGICKGLNNIRETTFQDIPAICRVRLSINGNNEIQFDKVYFYVDSLYTTRNFPITVNFDTDDPTLYWYDYDVTYQFLANRRSNVEKGNEVYVDPFWGWASGEHSVISDLFSEGTNTLVIYDEDADTALRFQFSSRDPESQDDDNKRFIFSGIDCNKTLIITESLTDGANDPRGQGWSYPYISSYEIKDNGGSSGDSTTAWYELPIYNYTFESNTEEYGLDRSMSIASLWIPYNEDTGMCIYTSWQDLMENTGDVNKLFEYANDAIVYNGPEAFIKNKDRGDSDYYVATWDSSDIHQIDSITTIPLNSFPIAQLIPAEKMGAIGAVMARNSGSGPK